MWRELPLWGRCFGGLPATNRAENLIGNGSWSEQPFFTIRCKNYALSAEIQPFALTRPTIPGISLLSAQTSTPLNVARAATLGMLFWGSTGNQSSGKPYRKWIMIRTTIFHHPTEKLYPVGRDTAVCADEADHSWDQSPFASNEHTIECGESCDFGDAVLGVYR